MTLSLRNQHALDLSRLLRQVDERYGLIHARFAAMTPAQQADFLALLGIDYSEVAPLSKVIDAELREEG
jgi:hypothetical protein